MNKFTLISLSILFIWLISSPSNTFWDFLKSQNPTVQLPEKVHDELASSEDASVTYKLCPHCNSRNNPKRTHCIRCGRSLNG